MGPWAPGICLACPLSCITSHVLFDCHSPIMRSQPKQWSVSQTISLHSPLVTLLFCSLIPLCSDLQKYERIAMMSPTMDETTGPLVSGPRVRTHPSPGAVLCLAEPGLCQREKLVSSVGTGDCLGQCKVSHQCVYLACPHHHTLPVTCTMYICTCFVQLQHSM